MTTVETEADDVAAARRLAAAIAGQQAYDLNRKAGPTPLTPEEHAEARRLAAADQSRFEYECRQATSTQVSSRVVFGNDPDDAGMLPTIAEQRAQVVVTVPLDSYRPLSETVKARIIQQLTARKNSGYVGGLPPWFNPSDGEIVPERVIQLAPGSQYREALLLYPFEFDPDTAELILSQARWARDRALVWVRPGNAEPE